MGIGYPGYPDHGLNHNRDRIVMVTTNYTEAEENTLREGSEQVQARKNSFSVILSASESERESTRVCMKCVTSR